MTLVPLESRLIAVGSQSSVSVAGAGNRVSQRHRMAIHDLLITLLLLAGFGGHCLMAPAAGAGAGAGAGWGLRLLEPGSAPLVYGYESTLVLNEAAPAGGKDVGYRLTGRLTAHTVWQSAAQPDTKLVLLKFVNPKLSIKSRKAPSPEGFVTHASKLEELMNGPFLIHWNNGHVKSTYINQNEPVAMINLKKGIASIFQFQYTTQEVKESDASGLCTVMYTNLDKNMVEKIKTNCKSELELPFIKHPDKLWGATVSSERRSVILLTADLTAIESVESEERHELQIPLREEAGAAVISQQSIKLQDTERSSDTMVITESSVDAAVSSYEKKSGQSFAKHSLTLTKEAYLCVDGTCPSFFSMVKANREALQSENLGTIKSASAFVKLLSVAREAMKDDLVKALKNSKNKNILLQLLDIMGAAQTKETHEAAMKVLDFKSQDSLDKNERYLWSLSLGSHPVKSVIKDLLTILESGPYGDKLDETLLLSISAMTNKLKKQGEAENMKVEKEVLSMVTGKLNKCSPSDDNCCLKYIRSLKNLVAADSVPILLDYAVMGNKKVSVAAVNALHSFPQSYWSSDVLKTAKGIYFQLDKRYDSSARTLALDMLLEAGPNEGLLADLLRSLLTVDSTYEVRQYLVQRLRQLGGSDVNLMSSVKRLMKSLNYTRNYNVLSLRGLSTAFTRDFMKNPSANGTLSTIQEMSGGIVKRGLVDVIVDKDGSSESIFTLGLFSGGLSSFLSSDDKEVDEGEAEVEGEGMATAGMDLTVMGVQVRPFVFFSGQGELMGHVWSGTASEKTPAFQALGLLQDHLQYISLQAGLVSELSLQGGVSFDLSGQIALSLWNRNAESLVEKSAGLSTMGLIRVNSIFVHSHVQFTIATEVHLRLTSNIDFYNQIALCLQLQQPDSTIKHNVHKVERIPGSKHRLRKSKYKTIPVPGRTYALNQKNNEMCNVIFTE